MTGSTLLIVLLGALVTRYAELGSQPRRQAAYRLPARGREAS
jgi:hypothetical protein